MKKFFTYALAAATLVGFSACSNEEDGIDASKAYLKLGISVDNALATRATQYPTITDWYAFVEGSAVIWGEAATRAKITADLGTTPLAAGEYTIYVSNFPNESAAYASTVNNGFGAAYYEGTAFDEGKDKKTLVAGVNDVTIDCGTAKNSKFKIDASGFHGNSLSVNVTKGTGESARNLTFANSTLNNEAFFEAASTLNFTVTYAYPGVNSGATQTTDARSLKLGAGGTVSTLTISDDNKGTISLTISYDDSFGSGTTSSVVINATNGTATITPAS